MIRWTDLIGFAGFALVVIGTLLLFSRSVEDVSWGVRAGGLALWFAGFGFVVGWLLLRWRKSP
jgi:uncharacterized membrane protein